MNSGSIQDLKTVIDDTVIAVAARGVPVAGKSRSQLAELVGMILTEQLLYVPLVTRRILDPTHGAVCYLDATFPELGLLDRVAGLVKVRLYITSANPAITGNIVLVPSLDGVELEPVTVAVSGAIEPVHLSFANLTGVFKLRRDLTDPADTLQDGAPVTAIVTAVRIQEAGL